MKIGVIGRGKLSWLVEEVLENTDISFYDDTINELGNISDCKENDIFVCIGNNAFRRKMFDTFVDRNLLSVTSSNAHVSKYAVLGKGALVSPFCSIHAHAKLGLGCLLYSNTVIDVGAQLGDFCRLSPRVYVGDKAVIGNGCVINAGVTILPGIEIGENCYITAGSVVTRSFGSNETISGVPARSVNGNNELHSH